MSGTYRLYGCKGWGSLLPECFLALCGVPFEFDDVEGFDRPGPARDRLAAVNPLAQVPALVLPGGEAMTESAAIALLLAERHPEAGLAPAPDDPHRAGFLRWLIWLVANVYPTFTFGDYPERYAASEAELLKTRVGDRRKALWQQLESAIAPDGGWVLGRFSALDVYVTVMTRWQPRREWFARECPKLHGIALRGDSHPVLLPVLQRNFPS